MKEKYKVLEEQIKKVFNYCVAHGYKGYLVSYQDYDNEICSYFTVDRSDIRNLNEILKKEFMHRMGGIEIISVLDLLEPYNSSELERFAENDYLEK